MKHSGSVATTIALGHVKIGNTMTAANDGTLDLKDGAVTTDKIADGSVTEEKMESLKDLAADESTLTMAETSNVFTLSVKDGGIATAKIADGAVTTAKISDGSVTREKITPEAIGATRLATDAVQTAKIQDGAVTTAKIADEAISESKIGEYAVTSTKINPGAVISSKIAEGAVGTNALADGAVTNAKIADEAITYLKIAPVLRQSVLDFQDTNGDELNGQEWGYTFSTAQENPRIGNVPNNRLGRLIDFTLSFEFTIPQSTIGARTAFEIIVWRGELMTTNTIYDRRTIYVTDESPFVHERFSFITNDLPEIKINFGQVDALSRVLLKNIQLRGFGIL